MGCQEIYDSRERVRCVWCIMGMGQYIKRRFTDLTSLKVMSVDVPGKRRSGDFSPSKVVRGSGGDKHVNTLVIRWEVPFEVYDQWYKRESKFG